MRHPARTICLGLTVLMLGGALYSQRFRGFGFFEQNDPPPTEFIFARLHYGAGRGGGGWSHDYPDAEEHINQIVSEATALNVERMSYRVVELSSPELFTYPFAYISEPGEMDLTEEEILNLREYVNRGGFVMVDDFDGPYALENLRENLRRVFPDRDIFRLTIDHEIFHTFYDIDSHQIMSPYNVGADAVFYGYPDGRGGLAMIICHNNDVGDFWEWIDRPEYPLKPSAEALRLGINFFIYAMTH